MNYEKEIKIDETALDVEWLDQPDKMLKISTELAKAKFELDIALDNLDQVKSKLDKDIRSDPDAYELPKVTDVIVGSAIIRQDEYKEANQEVIQARYNWQIAKGAVDAFEQRKNALENLVRLYGQQYFAGPKAPRDLQAERQMAEEMKQKTNKGVSSKLNRKRRSQ